MLVSGAPALAAPLDPTGGLRFDFGSETSPVADGYRQVPNTMLYDPGRGYGLDRVTSFRDRGTGDPLLRDFVNGQHTFMVDLPAGDYHLTIYSGDAIASNHTTVTAEGVGLGTISTAAGDYGPLSTVVGVGDGQLNLAFGQDGRVNGIEIVRVAAPTGLRVVSRTLDPQPAVHLAWDPVPDAARYAVYRGGTADGLAKVGEVGSAEYEDRAVELGLGYVYAVTTVTAAGVESARSQPLAVAMREESVPAPAAPQDFRLDSTTTQAVTLAWQGVGDALAYYVYRAEAADGPFRKAATVTGTRYTDTAVPSANYHYRVHAVGRGGLSESTRVVRSPITYRPMRQMERLDRGLMALPTPGGILVSWRMLGTDPASVGFNLYRDGVRVNRTPISDVTNHLDAQGTPTSSYSIAAVLSGKETARSASVTPWGAAHLDVPLQRPPGGVTPDGASYTYSANDASVGDLDGDGQYEIVLKWDPSNSRDNSQSGYTGEVFLDAYELDGTRLWRIAMGRNIRAGAHYTQFLVYDLDGDGRAEVVARTADATVDGRGTVIGDANADHRNSDGYVLSGPELLTVFDGRTGAALVTTDYEPPRGTVCDWGDCYGNRVDRFLAAVAYLDGERPSFVMARGYYTRTVLVAYDWRDGRLTKRWTFDSDVAGEAYEGQGNHNLAVADVDRDGRDEIVYGALVVDDNGAARYTTNLFHGDALHVGDLDPARPGLEVFGVHEPANARYGYAMHDAATGQIHWGVFTGRDTGRGTAADIDPRYPGAEAWAVDGDFNSPTGSLHTAGGELISITIPAANHVIWWDGDLQREILDHNWSPEALVGVGTIGKWDPENSRTVNLLTATGTFANNGTKGNPSLQADLLGDWREEAIWRTEDSSALRVYATPHPSPHRFSTLMHDPVYRLGVAWQNVGYNQPPHTSFYLGGGMVAPAAPHIRTGPAISAAPFLVPGDWRVGGRWTPLAVAVVRLPGGSDAAAVVQDSVRILLDGVLVDAHPSGRGRLGNLFWVVFDGAALSAPLTGYDGAVEVTISGQLSDGRALTGVDTIRLR
jgi:fibronectin type 3 domain-containing protein